ncbi:MAG: STAS domain-containing protein [Acidimicrobiales bacterium]
MKAHFAIEPAEPDAIVRGVRVLRIYGDVDASNATDFEAVLREACRSGEVVVDLTPVAYCDSAAFAVLDRLLASGGVALALETHHPVHRAAVLMGLRVCDSVALATDALGR